MTGKDEGDEHEQRQEGCRHHRRLAGHGRSPCRSLSRSRLRGAQQLIVTGDITNIPALNMRNPGMNLVLDSDSALAEASRRKMFERAIAEKAVLTGYHWGVPGAGTIAKDGAGYALVPVA